MLIVDNNLGIDCLASCVKVLTTLFSMGFFLTDWLLNLESS